MRNISTSPTATRRWRHSTACLAIALALAGGSAAAQTYDFAFQIGGFGTGPGQFQYPQGVAVDSARSRILVTDGYSDNVQAFATVDGTYLSGFGSAGSQDGQLGYPTGIRVDPLTGNIVVADYDNARMQLFTSGGTYLSQFGSAQLDSPCDVAIDPVTRHIFVPDAFGARVDIFDISGAYLGSFGSSGTGPGQFTYACGVTFDTATSHVFVDDEVNNNVQVFSTGGTYLGVFGSVGTGQGQFHTPGGMAIDPVSRDIFVADYGNDRIEIFNPSGSYIGEFGTFGSGDGQLTGPDGLDIDRATGLVFVADRGNARVEAFAPTSDSSCGPTVVSVSVDPPTALESQSLLFSALASIHSPFAGTVSFVVDGGATACVANMDDVSASCLHPLSLGTHSVVAQYSGDGFNPPGCSAPQQVTIVADSAGSPTGLGCISLPDPAVQGQPVQVVCTVQPPANAPMSPQGTLNATGYVTYAQGATVLGNVPLVFGTATYTNILAGGDYPITATYSGDAENASSNTEVTVVVNPESDSIFYGGFEVPPQ
ncbi:MAG TPA: Ig-like domain repeat protein [Rhodanobacteraceae bacterium]